MWSGNIDWYYRPTDDEQWRGPEDGEIIAQKMLEGELPKRVRIMSVDRTYSAWLVMKRRKPLWQRVLIALVAIGAIALAIILLALVISKVGAGRSKMPMVQFAQEDRAFIFSDLIVRCSEPRRSDVLTGRQGTFTSGGKNVVDENFRGKTLLGRGRETFG